MKRSLISTAFLATVWLIDCESMPADPASKPTRSTSEEVAKCAKEVTKRLFGTCWYEMDKVIAGKRDPSEPLGWKFGAKEVENWQITGELVTFRMMGGATIDVSKDVWRMDILSKDERGRVSVLPTIFKFEGDTLVWVTEFPGEGWYSEVARDKEYKGRPTGFKSTKENRYDVRRLRPCDYLQTTPPE